MGKKEAGKPRGRMTPYACFVQVCREEHKKKHPNESIVFAEFSKKCAEKWKTMGAKDKKRFEDMADRDKQRYEREMANYTPPAGQKKKKKKDPNAPKRSLSAFFFFCQEERASVKAKFPDWGVGDVAKELGKRWELCQNRPKYEAMAVKDKARYEKAMAEYRKQQGSPAKKAAPAPKKAAAAAAAVQDDDDDEEEDDDDDEDDD